MRANLSISENPPTGAIRATGSRNSVSTNHRVRRKPLQSSLRQFAQACLDAILAGRIEPAGQFARLAAREIKLQPRTTAKPRPLRGGVVA